MNRSRYNSHLAKINELSLCWLLNHRTWVRPEDEQAFRYHAHLIQQADTRQAIAIQIARAIEMAKVVEEALPDIAEAHWIGSNRKYAVSLYPALSPKHPADILMKLSTGIWMGLSAKSCESQSDSIGFKNIGMGHLEKYFSVELAHWNREAIADIVARGAPRLVKDRKPYLREHPDLRIASVRFGSEVLHQIRDGLLIALQGASQAVLKAFLETSVLDCSLEHTNPT